MYTLLNKIDTPMILTDAAVCLSLSIEIMKDVNFLAVLAAASQTQAPLCLF